MGTNRGLRSIRTNIIMENSLFQVLLYYVYVPLSSSACKSLADWFKESCLGCTGRIRVALDGLNVVIKGKASDIHTHIENLSAHDLFHGLDIDFKLANASSASEQVVTKETGFDGLSIRVCAELVTLGPLAEGTSLCHSGVHLSPQEFHQALLEAASSSGDAILFDARNLYETRLGRFELDGVPTIDPKTRVFSDLPPFIISNRHLFKENTSVFMYCTGGVRCERSSAFLSENVPGCKVFQLKGGIHRYLETFGGDGLFVGKNFVYDERIGVASEIGREVAVGRCLSCSQPWDDYSSRSRCRVCRMLILICNSCLASKSEAGPEERGCMCEICRERVEHSNLQASIRQNHHRSTCPSPTVNSPSSRRESGITRLTDGCASIASGDGRKPKLRILCLHGFRQTAGSFLGRTIGLRRRLGDDIDWFFVEAPHSLPHMCQSTSTHPPPPAAAKRCWLLDDAPSRSDEELNLEAGGSSKRLLNQTRGLTESLSRIMDFARAYGPFDGVLGFSQGSALSAIMCQLQQEGGELGFTLKFAILASGYSVNALPSQTSSGPIRLPSLHIFRGRNEPGPEGGHHRTGPDSDLQTVDHQVPASASEALLGSFDPGQRLTYRHGQGHLIPCNKQCVDILRSFLDAQALEQTSKIPS